MAEEPRSLDHHRLTRNMPSVDDIVPLLRSGEGVEIPVVDEDAEQITEARTRIRAAAKRAEVKVQTIHSRSHRAVLGMVVPTPEEEAAGEEREQLRRQDAIRRHRVTPVDDE